MLTLLAMATGWGQDLDDRQTLSDAMLVEAAHGDVAGAVQTYEALAKRLPADDPLRGDVLFALGRATWVLGDTDTSRTWLLEGIRTGACPTRCRDLLERVELERASVASLPIHWSFDADGAEHALFHPWRFQERGSIRTSSSGTLVWRTTPDRRQPDRLTMGFRDVGTVSALSLRLASVSRDAALQIVVLDVDDQRFGLQEALRVPAGAPYVAKLTPDAFVPVQDTTGRLDPTRFAELWLVDISDEGAPLVIELDTLDVR